MLTEAQIADFMRDGYVVLRGVIPEAARAYAADKIWAAMPPHFQRDRPNTWTGKIRDCRTDLEILHRRGHVKFQKTCPVGNIGLDPTILSLVSENPQVLVALDQLIGAPLGRPRVRGLYSVWPIPKLMTLQQAFGNRVRKPWRRAIAEWVRIPNMWAFPSQGHIEAHGVQVVAVGYITPAPHHGGAMNVWPGSHLRLFPLFKSVSEHVPTDDYNAVLEDLNLQSPVQVAGQAGDVVLFHHRLLHGPSVNRKRQPRHAVFVDFSRTDASEISRLRPAGMWEQWPALRDRNQPLLATAKPRPASVVRTTLKQNPWIARTFKKYCGVRTKITPGQINLDVRAKRPGDFWAFVSETDHGFNSNGHQMISHRAFGPDLAISIGDLAVSPMNGPNAPLLISEALRASASPSLVIHSRSPGSLFVKIVQLTLPFHESPVVFRAEVSPGEEIDVSHLRDVSLLGRPIARAA